MQWRHAHTNTPQRVHTCARMTPAAPPEVLDLNPLDSILTDMELGGRVEDSSIDLRSKEGNTGDGG